MRLIDADELLKWISGQSKSPSCPKNESAFGLRIMKHIDRMPSAQLETCKSVEDILQYLDYVLHPIVSPDNWNVYAELYDMISDLPSAQPDIIACGDCKHYIPHDKRCGYWNHGVKPLEWCCHAERRTDDGE